MFKPRSNSKPVEISGEAFGVGLTLGASDQGLLGQMIAWLPPQWHQGGDGVNAAVFRLIRSGAETYELDINGSVQPGLQLGDAIDNYERALRNHIASAAPAEHLFIHAGVVAHLEKAIVIPGPSFSGKTTLVNALVEAGAVYFSDEYAVIDAAGMVHAYPKPISMRAANLSDPKVHHVPGVIGDQPAPLGAVVCTQYRSDATWDPEELTPAQAALELVQHARAPFERASETLATLAAAAAGALTLKGPRGGAPETAAAILARVAQSGR